MNNKNETHSNIDRSTKNDNVENVQVQQGSEFDKARATFVNLSSSIKLVFTAKEIEVIFDISKTTRISWTKSGTLTPSICMCGRTYYRVDEVYQCLEANRMIA